MLATQPIPHIVVLSYNNVGNFGDRLGFHVLNHVLPPRAKVTYAHFRPWDVPAGAIDLLILGIGNSLFQPLLTDPLLRLVERVPRAVGIFGTQYREMIDRERLGSVLDQLDHWYARYTEDIEWFGAGRDNVSHLGDWLIDAFPMAQPFDSAELRIEEEMWNDLPMDRVIQCIQRHERVFSGRLHPLLCALTSARQVAYAEQVVDGLAAGKFRSMLLDVFGQEFPEHEFFPVSTDHVVAYKQAVRNRIRELELRLAGVVDPCPV